MPRKYGWYVRNTSPTHYRAPPKFFFRMTFACSIIQKSGLVNGKIWLKNDESCAMFPILITEVLINFYQKNILGSPKCMVHGLIHIKNQERLVTQKLVFQMWKYVWKDDVTLHNASSTHYRVTYRVFLELFLLAPRY